MKLYKNQGIVLKYQREFYWKKNKKYKDYMRK